MCEHSKVLVAPTCDRVIPPKPNRILKIPKPTENGNYKFTSNESTHGQLFLFFSKRKTENLPKTKT